MSTIDEQFWQELSAAFKAEADEHIKAMTSGLLELEKTSDPDEQKKIVETVFREAHSLKGAARAVDSSFVEEICQALENIFAVLKREPESPAPVFYDTLLAAIDVLNDLIANDSTAEQRVPEIINQLNTIFDVSEKAKDPLPTNPAATTWQEPAAPGQQKKEPAKKESVPLPDAPTSENQNIAIDTSKGNGQNKPKNGRAKKSSVVKPETVSKRDDTIRISSKKLDALLLQTEEMLTAKLVQKQLWQDLNELSTTMVAWHKEWLKKSKEHFKKKFDVSPQSDGSNGSSASIHKLNEFLDWNLAQLKNAREKVNVLSMQAKSDYWVVSEMVDNLLEEMKKVLMLPFSTILSAFPKMVRDISRERNKEVDLTIIGGDVEIDKRVLEAIKDPLIHLVRNSIDHGIETKDVRAQKGKNPKGAITIAISQMNGNKVEILISDDGSGIDPEKVKKSAIQKGIIARTEAEELSDKEALYLIFESELSTSPIITDISGRGLGLAIVRENVEKLGGVILVETSIDRGTTFRIHLPLTLATFRGILIRVSGHLFVMPTINVEQALRIPVQDVKTVENRETIQLNGEALALVHMADILELNGKPIKADGHEFMQVLILALADKRIAFCVDEVLNEQEILIKSLGKNLLRVRNIAGATVLGNGQIVPVLNVADLLKSALKTKHSFSSLQPDAEPTGPKSVLIAEDSITSRMLIKNILESAGYRVHTTVDGAEAWKTLKARDFDLVVSDVEMPRMNGFELTGKIRSDEKLKALPVILVTSLGSKQDRERGIDAGANAYIVKSGFDQNNLLEVVNQLI